MNRIGTGAPAPVIDNCFWGPFVTGSQHRSGGGFVFSNPANRWQRAAGRNGLASYENTKRGA
jgi:hypothetical protein